MARTKVYSTQKMKIFEQYKMPRSVWSAINHACSNCHDPMINLWVPSDSAMGILMVYNNTCPQKFCTLHRTSYQQEGKTFGSSKIIQEYIILQICAATTALRRADHSLYMAGPSIFRTASSWDIDTGRFLYRYCVKKFIFFISKKKSVFNI